MIVFYDQRCPLCNKEMIKLKQADKEDKITLVNIHSTIFEQKYSYIKRRDAMAFLHGQTAAGEMLYGLDVTIAAWQLVGKQSWLKVLKLPVICLFADIAYWLFAKYRQPIMSVVCKSSCSIKP